MSEIYLALDLGGTNAKFGLVSKTGEILDRGRFPVLAERGPEPIVRDLVANLKSLLDRFGRDIRPQALAVGAAGQVRPETGEIVFAPNLPGWRDIPLGGLLSEALDLEVRLENDADLYALGEYAAGAGRGTKNLVCLTLGTGVGGGLVLDGRIWSGPYGSAAEVGHVIIQPEGAECGCGGRGCLETLASATAMAAYGRELLRAGEKTLFKGSPEQLDSAELFRLAGQGDQPALKVFRRAGWALGVGLSGILNLLGLEAVIIGGGAAPVFPYIRDHIMKEISTRVFTIDPDRLVLSQAVLGDDAPLAGVPALFGNRPER